MYIFNSFYLLHSYNPSFLICLCFNMAFLGIKKSLGRAQFPSGILLEQSVVLTRSLGYLWAYPGLIHYILLICENVSLDWSKMQLVGNYGCQ